MTVIIVTDCPECRRERGATSCDRHSKEEWDRMFNRPPHPHTAERDAAIARVKELEAALHEFNRDCEDGCCDKCRLTAKLLAAKGPTT